MTSQQDHTVIEKEVATKLQEPKYMGEGEELPLGTSAQNHCRGKKDFRMSIRGTTGRQEISTLSAQERNHILELIHGVFVGNDDENDNIGRHFLLAGHARRSNEEMLCTGRTPSMDHEHGLSSESISCNNDLHDVMSRSREDDHGIGGSENMTVEGKARRQKQREGQTKARDQNSSVVSRKSQRQTHHNVKYEHSLFIQEKLEELEQAICQIKQKDAYNVAVQDLHGYVEDPSFRLVFLRADSYNVKKAASRLVSYMGEKLKRFGLQALTRQLTIGDLGGTSKSLLVKEGVVQILPTRDSSGRAVFVAHYHSSKLRHLLRNDPKSLVSFESHDFSTDNAREISVILTPRLNHA